MDDEIDIEEHDVLDNPRIKNIFPDLTIIKTEAPDIEEEPENFVEDQNGYEEVENGYGEVENGYGEVENGYGEIENGEEYNPGYEDWTQEDQNTLPVTINEVFTTKIILGNKPNPQPMECDYGPKEYLETYVLLEDWGQILNNNPCFCPDCKTLFATQNALDAHNMIAHSFLVETPVNKAIKSTAKSHNLARKSTVYQDTDSSSCQDEENAEFCNHCNKYFSDGTELIKHLYELLTKTLKCFQCNAKFENEADLNAHKLTHNIKKNFYSCPICSCYFKIEKNIAIHMKNNHNQHKIELSKVAFDANCMICRSVQTLKSYNTHIQRCHWNTFFNGVDKNGEKYKCSQCNLVFTRYSHARHHRDIKHPEFKNMRILFKTSLKTVSSAKSVQVVKNAVAVSVQNYKISRRKTVTAPVPKSILFKCKDCHTHFHSCSGHLNKCSKKQGDWRCGTCKRFFSSKDRDMHLLQHKFTSKFKIYAINDEVYSKTLCKCPICNVHFEERKFWLHLESSCGSNEFDQCGVCKINIDKPAVLRHTKRHKTLAKSDFIIIEFATENSEQIEAQDDVTPKENLKRKLSINPKGSLDKSVVYYCYHCKCYCSGLRHRNSHIAQKCKKSAAKIQVCKDCGLTVTGKTLSTHKRIHSEGKNSITDYTFLRIQDLKPIIPPVPEYNKCRKCGIRSISKIWLYRHSCETESFKTCHICNNKFTLATYKLHYPFHLLGKSVPQKKMKNVIPELLEKYESMQELWNLLYLCSTCDVVTHSYDNAVDHCQNHFNNLESYDVTIENCKICNLNFDSKCFERHRELHEGTLPVTRDSFKILKYNYIDLLKNTWMNLFGGSPMAQIDQVISKSIYKFSRGIKMRVVSDGPPQYTLYKCNLCSNCIDPSLVIDHVKSECTASRFICNICQMSFATIKYREEHKSIHETVGVNLRVVTFNEIADREFNQVLLSNFPSKKPVFKVKSNVKIASKVYYQCTQCKVCIQHKKNQQYHACHRTSYARYHCPLCDCMFSNTHKNLHIIAHKTTKFSNKNIKTIPFTPKRENNASNSSHSVELYKCKCGIHFTSLKSIQNHSIICGPELKMSTENCSKCGLLFATDVLVNHLCNHHSNGDKEIKVIDYVPAKFYKCPICQLLFLENKYKHFAACRKGIYKGVKCIRCGLEFHSTQVGLHRKLHKDCSKWLLNREYSIIDGMSQVKHNNKLFKCSKCEIYYFTRKGVRCHFESNHRNGNVGDCNICGLTFPDRTRPQHVYVHHEEQNLKREDFHIEIIDFDAWATSGSITAISDKQKTENQNEKAQKCDGNSGAELQKTVKEELFKCKSCDVCYLNVKSIRYHFVDCNHKMLAAPSQCSFCKLNFAKYTLTKHLHLHHKQRKLKAKDFLITVIDDDYWEDPKKVKDKPPILHPETIEPDLKRTQSNEITETVNTVTEEKTVTETNCDDDKIINKCTKCQLYFTKSAHTCRQLRSGSTKCSICNKRFLKSDYLLHKSIHETKNYSKDDFVVKLVIPKYSLTGKCIFSPDSGYMTTKVYQCHLCSVNFLKLDTLHKHLSQHAKVRKVQCDECDLIFTKNTFSRHVYFQHKKMKLKRDDIEVIFIESKTPIKKEVKSPSNEPVSTRKMRLRDSVPQREESPREGPSREDSLREELPVSTRKMRLRDSVPHREASPKEASVREEPTRETPLREEPSKEVPSQSENKIEGEIRLFKCKHCNVYFIAKSTCLRHILDHKPLNSKEYIECKFCSFQFKLNSLAGHMMRHHDTEFNLEKVVIEEFEINESGPPKIEIYQAIDRLQSRVVTTTTDIKIEPKVEPSQMEVDIFKCSFCDETFTNSAAMKFHESLEHLDNLALCEICHSSFNESILKMHLKIDNDACVCCLCNVKITVEGLNEHAKIHNP